MNRFMCWLLTMGFASAMAAAEPTVRVQPIAIQLKHVRQPHSLLVSGVSAEGYTLDLTSGATFASANASIATVDAAGIVHPISSGVTEIKITANGQTVNVPVTVQLPATDLAVQFPPRGDAGALQGRLQHGGLPRLFAGQERLQALAARLGPRAGPSAITKETFGRRLNPAQPEHSLLVAKPLGDVPHEGGVRFARGSLSHEILLEWITQGAPGDLQDEAQVVRVRLFPDKLVLAAGQKHRLQLIADYTDGTTRDVTPLGVFTANNEQFADVDDEGLVTAGDAGETAIVGPLRADVRRHRRASCCEPDAGLHAHAGAGRSLHRSATSSRSSTA